MSQNIIHRTTAVDLEIRTDDQDQRIVSGIAVPLNSPTVIHSWEGDFEEVIQRGAFRKTIAERGDRVKFLAHHDARSMPLGRAILLEERAEGLYAEFRVSKTQAGDEALELIRDGAIDALSIGFRVINDRWSIKRDKRTVTEAALMEVSAVNFPAYDGAKITGTRALDIPTPEQLALRLRLLELDL